MNWKTANRLYLHNPTIEELKDINNYNKAFIIIDEAYYISKDFTKCIDYLKLTPLKKTLKIRFIFIRSTHIPKKVTKISKESIRNLFANYKNISIETAKNFYIKTDTPKNNVFRITNIPNTIHSDYICCGTDNMFDKSTLLRISGLIEESIVDGIGMRYVVFTQGCPHHCEGCHNSQTWDFKEGSFITINSIYEQIIQNPMLNGVTFSGGEPFMQADALYELLRMLKLHYKKINKSFNYTLYSGFTLEQLQNTDNNKIFKLLYNIDYLIDGRFDINQKSMDCKFRGSKNQKMYERIPETNQFKEIYPVEK